MSKSGTRRILCKACFGQGLRSYVADSTRRRKLRLRDYQAVDPWGFDDDFSVYCTGVKKTQAFVRRVVCRSCCGTGWVDSSAPWVVHSLRKGVTFESFLSSYAFYTQYREDKKKLVCYLEEMTNHHETQWQQAATIAYEIPKLDAKVNRIHRRAQKAEGQNAYYKNRYEKEHARAERLLQEIRRLYKIDKPLRGGRPAKSVKGKRGGST